MITETNACFLFLPAKKTTTTVSFFYRSPEQDFALPRLGCTPALSYSLAFPNIIALNAVHRCSQREFPVNIEGAVKTLSFYVCGSVFCRDVTEEQRDSGQQLGDTPLRQGLNLLMRLVHRGEKRRASARITEKSLYQEKHSPGCCWGQQKSTREQCFAGEQARFRPAQSIINQFCASSSAGKVQSVTELGLLVL